MRTIMVALFVFCSSVLFAQGPYISDSYTVGLWHLDEASSSVFQDASSYHNDAQAFGTSVVAGRFGNARYFNGSTDYAFVSDPANGSLDFGTEQSFTLEAWFKTESLAEQRIIRKGLAPVQGYELGLAQGKVFGIIGNREDGTPPDTLLRVISAATYNDNQWHHASVVRDRATRKLYLYVDGVQAATPVVDNFPYSLANNVPLGIGRWYGSTMPLYFHGVVDEVRISNIARHPGVVVSDTVGLWHLDETTGSTLIDSSPNHNNGTVYGASIVGGVSGNARYFNGTSSYAAMPSHASYNFQSAQSFTVRAWIKTSGTEGIIIRRGLVPVPGFQLSIHLGRAVGIIGNYKGRTWSDTLLTLTSNRSINDNVWHEIVLVRDRSLSKVFLYLDGVLATDPQVDNFTIPLVNDKPLTLGTWWDLRQDYFTGTIDEVGIFSGSRHPMPVVSDTVGLWHLDETTGSILIDSSPNHINGTAYGTSIVGGISGNARYFNGTSSYATMPSHSAYDFQSSESFTVIAWVKTTQQEGIIVRRGLDPIPGFQLSIHFGRAIGRIGNTKGNTWSDTLLTLTSAQLINDNLWHELRMVRDRSQGRLYLYVDGVAATSPAVDNFTIPLANTRQFTVGASLILPDYFTGPIDEVGIFRGARHPAPLVSDTVGLWHLDESSGTTLFDSSPLHNNGTAYGTSVVPGAIGNARLFNGTSSYATIVSHPAYDFQSSESFTVGVWVKTAGPEGIIIRRGLDPIPGFQISIHFGKAIGRIGNTKGNTWSDTLLTLTSTQSINDNVWHEIRMVRDRSVGKLFLYVDGVSAATPAIDNFTIPLTNTRPLTFGASLILPDYFTGPIDEVGIFRGARHPATATSDTVALYHYDETAGSYVSDSSPYSNHGTAIGTSIAAGRLGNARSFTGTSYVNVPNPPSLNFGTTQSFTVQLWFKTTQSDTGEMIRRGLAPMPGFAVRILDGHVQGIVGDSPYDQNLIRITSTRTNFNDNQWHIATLIRDRTQAKVFLYVDGQQAAIPLNDNLVNPIFNDRPLTMGRWESPVRPTFYRGILDEVAIFKGARHPTPIVVPVINVSPLQINFGSILVGSQLMKEVVVSNLGTRDTLHIGVETNNPVFQSAIPVTYPILPGTSRPVPVFYIPTAARLDTGSLVITSNDPSHPIVRVPLSGRGFTVSDAPFITTIRDIPDDQGKQVRVIWYRSIHDANGDSLRITDYSLWRRVGSNNALWDFVATIPAVRFDQYSYVAPTLFDSTLAGGIRWSIFKVSAHTAGGAQVFFSVPDSGYSVDNLPPSAPTNLIANVVAGRINLGWEQPTDPDIQFFAIYRSTTPNVLPTSENRVGTASVNSFIDQNAVGNTSYYYCIAAFDTAGNQSGSSNEVQIILTGAGGGNGLPTTFHLFQNYPNPFNPTSIVRYDVPRSGFVNITLYDMLGRAIKTLVNEEKTAGTFEISVDASGLSSGVYLYRMQAGTFVQVRKMLLMK
ncbi:MAG: T9SS type A sorting domain-containing protein [Ignavibacteriae bacterium]|nr:T9SS type A sorting domain-containing protein [Ignavibacteriota bacterium]